MSTPALVLIIDDELDIREMLAVQLEREGFEAVIADSGEAGLEMARARKFDLAITDLRMPGIDGIATLAGLRSIGPAIRVIVATGQASAETRESCRELGAAAVIQKPIDLAAICLAVHRTLEAA